MIFYLSNDQVKLNVMLPMKSTVTFTVIKPDKTLFSTVKDPTVLALDPSKCGINTDVINSANSCGHSEQPFTSSHIK